MPRNLQDIINSPSGIRVALGLGRILPNAIGHHLANFVGTMLAGRTELPMVQAARLNQWVVHGEQLTKEELDHVVRNTFRSTSRAIFDLYHNMQSQTGFADLIAFNQRYDALFEDIRRAEVGRILVAPHINGLDIIAYGSANRGVRILGLGYHNPKADYDLQNKMRTNLGLEAVPASMATLKLARRRLEEGGTVVTGIERPLPESKYKPTFFGRQAALPVHHIMLALKTDVPVYVLAPLRSSDGKYEILVSDRLIMERSPDRRTEIVHNAERILAVAEEYIRRDPVQWSMFYPVWPEVRDEVPG